MGNWLVQDDWKDQHTFFHFKVIKYLKYEVHLLWSMVTTVILVLQFFSFVKCYNCVTSVPIQTTLFFYLLLFLMALHYGCIHYKANVWALPIVTALKTAVHHLFFKVFLCFAFFFCLWFFRGRNLSDRISEANPWPSWGRYDQTTQCWADWCEANGECRQCSQTVLPVIWKPTGSVQLDFRYTIFIVRKEKKYIYIYLK
jgi:hypothetical protein